jgi:hypothetical protein
VPISIRLRFRALRRKGCFRFNEEKKMYEVVYPLGRMTQHAKSDIARLEGLDRMTIAELSNHKYQSEFTFKALEKILRKRYPNVKLIPHEVFGHIYGPQETEVINALPGKLKELEVDGVISGNGG